MNPVPTDLRRQIDACRPDSDDLALPELADLARLAESDRAIAGELARSRRFDQAVSAALLDASVPAGLLDRLLAATEPKVSPATAAVANNAASQPRSRLARRVAVGLISLTTLAAAMVGVLMSLPQPPRTIGQEELAGLVEEWTTLVNQSNRWKPATAATKAPAGTTVLAKPIRWRNFTTAAGESGVAYDCTPTGRQKVLLFVIRSPHKYGVAPLPFTRLRSASKGIGIAAWQRENMLFVLTVDEDNQRLDDYIRKRPEA
ncbi:MAG: hypothetical protein SFU86_23115 [Pirellulaceae bacterium]|nr:hypothetical protein [Pirellulaceae bacterium]